MAKIIQIGKVYYSDFRFKGRRIRRALSQNYQRAQEKLAKMILDFRAERYGEVPQKVGWDDFKKKYLSYCAGSKKPSSIKRDLAAMSALEKCFPLTQLSQLTPEILEHWKGRRIKDGTGKATINRDLNAIKALLHKAEAWGYIGKQNLGSVKRFKTSRGRLLFYTPDELNRLLSRCHGIWKTVCLLGARAGLRRGEIHTLEWKDIDFDRRRVQIEAKEGWEPKDYEARFVPLSDDLYIHLKGLRKPTGWVIADGNGKRPSLPVLSSYFRKISRKAGLKGSIHVLRHTFASHLIMGGASPKAIKDMLGHADLKTMEIYAHLAPESYHDAIKKLPAL